MPEHPDPSAKKPSLPDTMRTVAPYLHIGWTLVGAVLLGVLAGRWADARLGTEPLLLVCGAVLGIVAGLYHFLVTVLRR